MKKLCALLAAWLCLGLVACGSSSLLAPEAPRFDGGSTIGTGHRTDNTTTVTASLETTAGGDTIPERGGHTAGSGN